MPTRKVYDTILDIHGEPREDFTVRYSLVGSAFIPAGSIPAASVEIQADADGRYELQLIVGVEYLVEEVGAFVVNGSQTNYPPGTQYTLTVPDGDTDISVPTIRMLSGE